MNIKWWIQKSHKLSVIFNSNRPNTEIQHYTYNHSIWILKTFQSGVTILVSLVILSFSSLGIDYWQFYHDTRLWICFAVCKLWECLGLFWFTKCKSRVRQCTNGWLINETSFITLSTLAQVNCIQTGFDTNSRYLE